MAYHISTSLPIPPQPSFLYSPWKQKEKHVLKDTRSSLGHTSVWNHKGDFNLPLSEKTNKNQRNGLPCGIYICSFCGPLLNISNTCIYVNLASSLISPCSWALLGLMAQGEESSWCMTSSDHGRAASFSQAVACGTQRRASAAQPANFLYCFSFLLHPSLPLLFLSCCY